MTPKVITTLYDLVCFPDHSFPYAYDKAHVMDAIMSLLFYRPYLHIGKILETKEFSAETHVHSQIVYTNLYLVSHMST